MGGIDMSNNNQKTVTGISDRVSKLYRIDRVYIGDRTAEELMTDLVKVHVQTA